MNSIYMAHMMNLRSKPVTKAMRSIAGVHSTSLMIDYQLEEGGYKTVTLCR